MTCMHCCGASAGLPETVLLCGVGELCIAACDGYRSAGSSVQTKLEASFSKLFVIR